VIILLLYTLLTQIQPCNALMQAGRIETSGRLGLLYVAYQCRLMLNTNRPDAKVDSMASAAVWQLQFYVKLLVIVL